MKILSSRRLLDGEVKVLLDYLAENAQQVEMSVDNIDDWAYDKNFVGKLSHYVGKATLKIKYQSSNNIGKAIEQLQRADDTDLYVFLSGRGEQFKRCGKEYRWLRHDSVMINKNEWYRFSQNKGGHAIDFMKEFYGLSFAEAVKELLGEEGVGETNRRTAKEDAGRQKVCPIPLPGLELPERNESCEIARKYLIEQRKLSEQLVDQMIEKGDIYESKNYHNVVFVGRDKEQNPRYAAMRGTDENRYRGEARGSEKAYGFGHIGTDEKLFVFESPIDLLSYITAVPEEWEKHSYISLGGLSEKAMKRMYTEYPHIHSIYLCLDNDEPGNERCRQFVSLIPEELSVYRLEPVKKDWNECLVAEVPVENMAKQMCWRDAREKPVPVMKMWNEVKVSEAAERLSVSRKSASRCFDELEYLNIDVLGMKGKSRVINVPDDRKEFWKENIGILRNPVIRKFVLREDIKLEKKAGISALCEYSLLSDNAYPTYAVTKKKLKASGVKMEKQASVSEDIGCVVLELGYFIDFFGKGLQDPLSVALSLTREEQEERVKISVNEMLEEYVWSKD